MASLPLQAARRAAAHRRALAAAFPWTASPLVVAAPMRVFAGPALAVAVARAGGLGFVGPGATPAASAADLAEARAQLAQKPLATSTDTSTDTSTSRADLLPVGVGFQVWNGDLDAAEAAVRAHRPCAVWLFAPRAGQAELDPWTRRLRAAAAGTQIWIQVGTLGEARAAAASPAAPDALVVQGAEAGGHGRADDGIGLVALLPEVADGLPRPLPLVAAGGIADGRGAVAALGLGAAAVATGTRFLAAAEARVDPAYQAAVVGAADGAVATGRTHLYNHLRGTFGWPPQYSPRGLRNRSWADHAAGVPWDELQRRHDAAVAAGGTAAWGPDGRTATYAGAAVGLVRSVDPAAAIVAQMRAEVDAIKALV